MTTIIREMIDGLSCLVMAPADAADPDAVIMLLHGWGSDASDMMGLAPMLAERCPSALILAPDGPAPCPANPAGRQWFDLGMTAAPLDDGPDEAQPMLDALVTTLMQRHNLGPNRLVLAGFSQGCMMALHCGLRFADDNGRGIAGIIGFSGALLAPDRLAAEIRNRPQVLLVHGMADPVVPPQALDLAEKVLSDNDVAVSVLRREKLEHGIDAEGLTAALDFLAVVLDDTGKPVKSAK